MTPSATEPNGVPGQEQAAPGSAQSALAEQLRRLKQDSGLSYSRLAARIPYSRSALERYVNGRLLPPRDAVVALARVCGADPGLLTTLWEQAEAEQNPATTPMPADAPPGPGPEASSSPVVPAVRRRTARRRAMVACAAVVLVLALAAVLVEQGGSPGAAAGPRPAVGPGASRSSAFSSPTGTVAASASAAASAAVSLPPSPPATSSRTARASSPTAPGAGPGTTHVATMPAASPSPSATGAGWSGTVEVSNLNLDTEPPIANDNDHWSVDEVPGDKVISSSGPKLALWTGTGLPGQAECRDLVTTQGVDTVAIAAGSTICAETLDGNYAMLRITSITAQTAMADADVWD